MDVLLVDNIIEIISYLSIRDKIKFLSLSKFLHSLKNDDKISYNNKIRLNKIRNLWYYDRFTNVIANNTRYPLPKAITHLTFGRRFNNSINGFITNTLTPCLTHLKFGRNFNCCIKGCIPNSIKHLTF